jgi:hypothetical protein
LFFIYGGAPKVCAGTNLDAHTIHAFILLLFFSKWIANVNVASFSFHHNAWFYFVLISFRELKFHVTVPPFDTDANTPMSAGDIVLCEDDILPINFFTQAQVYAIFVTIFLLFSQQKLNDQ